MKVKSFLTLYILLLAGCFNSLHAYEFTNESLKYVISYKWGLIHKDAGEATLSMRVGAKEYNAILTAKTLPWADKLFMVRDTLKSSITKSTFRPKSYTKIAHEGDKYSRDDIKYTYMNSSAYGECKRLRIKDGKPKTTLKNLSSGTPAFDMLSIFYYLRTLDYSKLTKGKVVKAYLFSGSKVEIITIKNLGRETIKLRNNKQRQAYHISFNFTTEGGKKSSDDMDTWISADNKRIPLQLEGNLPIGKIKCYYIE